jgi:hypothetical protein
MGDIWVQLMLSTIVFYFNFKIITNLPARSKRDLIQIKNEYRFGIDNKFILSISINY